jgi:ABC-type multidrug transport system ATPase subunit
VHALINPPQIMTMDEPFRGLDAMIGGDEKRASALLTKRAAQRRARNRVRQTHSQR